MGIQAHNYSNTPYRFSFLYQLMMSLLALIILTIPILRFAFYQDVMDLGMLDLLVYSWIFFLSLGITIFVFFARPVKDLGWRSKKIHMYIHEKTIEEVKIDTSKSTIYVLKETVNNFKWIFLVMALPPLLSVGIAHFISILMSYKRAGIEFSRIYAASCLIGFALSLSFYYFKVHKKQHGK